MKNNKTIYPWLICSIGAIFYCYEYALRIFPSVVGQSLVQHFNIDAVEFGNLAAFYYYAYDLMQLPAGILLDRYHPKYVLIFALLICLIGNLLFAGNPLIFAEFGRFLVGLGSAFAFVGALKLIVLWLPHRQFAVASGTVLTLGMIGAMVSDILLGYFVKIFDWRVVNALLIGAGIIIVIIMAYYIPKNKKIDEQDEIKQTLPVDFKMLYHEVKVFLKNVRFLTIGIVGCLLYLPISVFAELWSISYLHQTYNVSNRIAAQITSMIFFGMAIGSPIVGWLSDVLRNRRLPLLICALINTIVLSIMLYTHRLTAHHLYFIYFLIGVFSSGQVLVFALAREYSPMQASGTAMALTNMIVMLGGVLLQPLVGILLDLSLGMRVMGNLDIYTSSDYRMALTILPISMAIATILTMVISETACRCIKKSQ